MLALDLTKPFGYAMHLKDVAPNPLLSLQEIGERRLAVMIYSNVDFDRTQPTVVSYDPDNGLFVYADARTPKKAYKLAQEKFQASRHCG